MNREPVSAAADKQALRLRALAARRAAHANLGQTAGDRIAAAFLGSVAWAPGQVVAGYWPIGDEADVRPLLLRLAGLGCIAALPVVVAKGAALAFRVWQPGTSLETGSHGTRHPPATAPMVFPDLVLLPLLGFDRWGGRLGYGGGYYDRTLAQLRGTGHMQAVGIAYAAQEVDALPQDRHDQRLDWIVTEEGAREALS